MELPQSGANLLQQHYQQGLWHGQETIRYSAEDVPEAAWLSCVKKYSCITVVRTYRPGEGHCEG